LGYARRRQKAKTLPAMPEPEMRTLGADIVGWNRVTTFDTMELLWELAELPCVDTSYIVFRAVPYIEASTVTILIKQAISLACLSRLRKGSAEASLLLIGSGSRECENPRRFVCHNYLGQKRCARPNRSLV
jgi:hypothetical protein